MNSESTPIYVLDSFAILALLQSELGSERVAALLREAERGQCRVCMSQINMGELAYILERRFGVERMNDAFTYLRSTAIQWCRVDEACIFAASHLKATYPISYADAFAAGLAMELEATLVTSDPEFRELVHVIQIEWLTPLVSDE
jgi:ribonuclease VapC